MYLGTLNVLIMLVFAGNCRLCMQHKTIMLVGATGSGKRNFIDGIANYLFHVNWEDNFRFTLFNLEHEENRRHKNPVSSFLNHFGHTIKTNCHCFCLSVLFALRRLTFASFFKMYTFQLPHVNLSIITKSLLCNRIWCIYMYQTFLNA